MTYGQEDTNNDRITIEWTNTPDGAAKTFRREWIEDIILIFSEKIHVCIGLVDSQTVIKQYETINPSFSESREARLIDNIIVAFEAKDVVNFKFIITKYCSYSQFDKHDFVED
uniref:YTH domain-containing protein n=1 Tax=Rhabditophanes sp. KR3021 TaxID=114890 RepID=A0AC35TTD5_9BILA